MINKNYLEKKQYESSRQENVTSNTSKSSREGRDSQKQNGTGKRLISVCKGENILKKAVIIKTQN